MKLDHLNQWTPRIFFLLVIILSFHFIRDVKYRDTKLGYVLDEGLEYRFSKEEEWKPYSFKQYISTKPDDLKIWIRIPIPKINPNSRFLFLRVIDGGSRIYFKGIEFYRSGIWSEDGKLIRFPNFFSHIVELPMEDARGGKTGFLFSVKFMWSALLCIWRDHCQTFKVIPKVTLVSCKQTVRKTESMCRN